MDIREATKSYEAWMRHCTKVIESELTSKHVQMRTDPFMFFRGTYHRWAQLWPEVCNDLRNAPKLLGVGDLHVGSYGTWRDSEGRLCWGVDDFDDSYPLPYTSDLVRLAASVKMVTDSQDLTIKFRTGCEAIKPPQDFWKTLLREPVVNHRQIPLDARKALEKTLPTKVSYKVVRRKAGMGSLGQLRFVAIAMYEGGYVAREAKATVPPASVWKAGKRARGERYYERAIASAVRSHDPYQIIFGNWLIRRLSPDSNPIEIDDPPKKRDEYALLHAMGKEAANVHLGTRKQIKRVLKDLHGRDKNWLRRAGKEMAKVTEKEWKQYRKSG